MNPPHPAASETARISDQLKRAFEGDAWHGPALLELLADVNAAMAAAHPVRDAHSIWELVLHLGAWDEVILRRMQGETLQPEGVENFPEVPQVSEPAWREAVERLSRKHQELQEAVRALPESRLTETVPGKDYDFYFMLHGEVQHALYHAGQIALLQKFRLP